MADALRQGLGTEFREARQQKSNPVGRYSAASLRASAASSGALGV